MTKPALFHVIAKQIAEKEGLTEIAKLYPANEYVYRKRSNGWRISIWREVASK